MISRRFKRPDPALPSIERVPIRDIMSISRDCLADNAVGSTVVAGYHRNTANGSIPCQYVATQLEDSNGPLMLGSENRRQPGQRRRWQTNGDQAIYSDPSTQTIYTAGAFTQIQHLVRPQVPDCVLRTYWMTSASRRNRKSRSASLSVRAIACR